MDEGAWSYLSIICMSAISPSSSETVRERRSRAVTALALLSLAAAVVASPGLPIVDRPLGNKVDLRLPSSPLSGLNGVLRTDDEDSLRTPARTGVPERAAFDGDADLRIVDTISATYHGEW